MGVAVTRSEVASALAGANAAASAVYQSLLDAGVAAGDLRTTGVQVEVEYDYDGKPPRPSGYQASQRLIAVVRDVSRAGDVIGAAAAAGGDATRIGGIQFDFDDDAQLLATARDLAFADARAKAEQYASASGAQLGEVLTISDHTDTPFVLAHAAAGRAEGFHVPIEAGMQDVTAHVRVTWALV
jgi:uncharacterized protein YggE